MKICYKCGLEKDSSEFYLCKGRKKPRLHFQCISCAKITRKEYYHQNRERSIRINREYNLKHPEKAKETRHRTYLKHKEDRLRKEREYKQKNRAKLTEKNKLKRKERRLKLYAVWTQLLQTYPIIIAYIANFLCSRKLNAQIARKLRGRINKKLRKRNLKQTASLDLIGCSVDELRIYIEKQWEPRMSWENHGVGPGKWQFDHIQPCCSFDLRDNEQQKRCFHCSNLQPLWFEEHRAKTSKDIKKKFMISL